MSKSDSISFKDGSRSISLSKNRVGGSPQKKGIKFNGKVRVTPVEKTHPRRGRSPKLSSSQSSHPADPLSSQRIADELFDALQGFTGDQPPSPSASNPLVLIADAGRGPDPQDRSNQDSALNVVADDEDDFDSAHGIVSFHGDDQLDELEDVINCLQENDDDRGLVEPQKKQKNQWEEEKEPDNGESSVLAAVGLSPGALAQIQEIEEACDQNDKDEELARQCNISHEEEAFGFKLAPELEKQKSEWQRPFPWDDTVQQANSCIFQNEGFRENQQEIINATKSGRNVIALIPTGGGKSLTFQLSAVVDQGVTVVIMPLISLIQDNLTFVLGKGIPACSLSSSNKSRNQDRSMGQLYSGMRNLEYKIVYTTPEKIVQSPPLIETLDELYRQGKIDRFVIDEVHCVSHWGQDFRKDYLNLKMLKQKYPKVPMLGLTATATVQVKDDIADRLGISRDVLYFQSSFNRTNLFYEIRDKKQYKNVEADIAQLLRGRFSQKSGIVYCISRKDCEQLAQTLKRKHGVRCDFYHADLSAQHRAEIQQQWMDNQIQVIIATIAFGMGINKRDVRFVIHYSLPKSLEGYSQECGRAGRDGQKADCILYYSYGDRKRNDYFIVNNQQSTGARKGENMLGLYSILDYCENIHECRRKLQLDYLGEEFDPKLCNKMCDNCRKDMTIVQKNASKEAQTIVSMMKDADDYGISLTMRHGLEVLRGKQPSTKFKISPVFLQRHSGALKVMKEDDIRRLMVSLLRRKVLSEQFSHAQAPHGGITVYMRSGRRAPAVLSGRLQITVADGVKKKEESDIDFQDQSQNNKLLRNETAPLKENKILKTRAPEQPQNLLKTAPPQQQPPAAANHGLKDLSFDLNESQVNKMTVYSKAGKRQEDVSLSGTNHDDTCEYDGALPPQNGGNALDNFSDMRAEVDELAADTRETDKLQLIQRFILVRQELMAQNPSNAIEINTVFDNSVLDLMIKKVSQEKKLELSTNLLQSLGKQFDSKQEEIIRECSPAFNKEYEHYQNLKMFKIRRKDDRSGAGRAIQQPVFKREVQEKQPSTYVKVSSLQNQNHHRSKKRGLDQISNVVGEQDGDDGSLLDRLAIGDDLDFDNDLQASNIAITDQSNFQQRPAKKKNNKRKKKLI